MSMALPLGPFWGVLAERFSRRAILLRTFIILSISLLLAAWAENLAWMVIARAMLGLSYGVGGVITATQAMVTPPRYIGRAVATVQTALPIAASIGPPLGALAIPHDRPARPAGRGRGPVAGGGRRGLAAACRSRRTPTSRPR